MSSIDECRPYKVLILQTEAGSGLARAGLRSSAWNGPCRSSRHGKPGNRDPPPPLRPERRPRAMRSPATRAATGPCASGGTWVRYGPMRSPSACPRPASASCAGTLARTATGRWIADFLIAPDEGGPDPASLDYLALAFGAHARDDAAPVVLTHYALDGSPDLGSVLYLEVRGPDRLGFLGSLLRALARLALSPREMMISTRDGEAFDRFFLQTVAARCPPTRPATPSPRLSSRHGSRAARAQRRRRSPGRARGLRRDARRDMIGVLPRALSSVG